MGRVARFAGHLGGLLALLHLPLQTAAGPKLDPTVYPPPDTFRQLQLAVLACGRENTAELCGTARLQADPLRRLQLTAVKHGRLQRQAAQQQHQCPCDRQGQNEASLSGRVKAMKHRALLQTMG